MRIKRVQWVTPEGLETIQHKLADLEQERGMLRNKLAELNQLKDAEEYDLAGDTIQLAFLEKQIAETRALLARCKVRDVAEGKTGKVQLGSVVRLLMGDKELLCTLVSAIEADPLAGKISDESPLGRALMGKVAPAQVEVQGPRKLFSYRIVGVA